MKTFPLLLAAAMAAGFSASAANAADALATTLAPSQVITPVNPSADLAHPILTRAEVKAEAREAERLGLIPRGEAHLFRQGAEARSALSRAQVKAETRLAVAAGLIPRGEQEFPSVTSAPVSTLSRAEVKAATRLAEHRGEIPRGESDLTRP